MFRGINTLTMDGKGRVAIPTRYRDALGSMVVMTIDPEDNCLLLYPLPHWEQIEIKLQALPSFNTFSRRIQRLLIGHATDLEVDKNGRILFPSLLRDYAGLTKRVLMVGQGNKFEIWDDEAWQEKRDLWLREEASLLEGLPDEMKDFSL